MSRARILFALACLGVLLAATAAASLAYPGSSVVLFAFSLSFGLLAGTAILPGLSIGYIFLAALLLLGFWLKLIAHFLFGYELIEPTGTFDGSAEQWDRALTLAALGAAGTAAGKLLAAPALARLIPAGSSTAVHRLPVPPWYARYRPMLWAMYTLILLVTCVANYHYAFYQIGVEPRLVLPAHLNVFPAWLVNVGFALGLAVLANWELALRPGRVAWLAAAVLVQALLVSVSALSRSIILFQAAPALAVFGIYLWYGPHRRKLVMIGSGFFLATILVATAVTTVRFITYPLTPSQVEHNFTTGITERMTPLEALRSPHVDEPSKAAIRDGIRAEILRHLGKLVIGRWIGLEGVLAVSSSRETGFPLLVKAAREDPRLGNASLYQRISQADRYAKQSEPGRFTFLTLPGVMGVLAYADSGMIVCLGMLLAAIVLLATERISIGGTRNPFFGATAGVALANVLAQLNFPYLTLVFFAQLLFATALVTVVQRWPHVLPGVRRTPSPL